MSQNITNMNHQIVENYNIFARVSPSQKKDLIKEKVFFFLLLLLLPPYPYYYYYYYLLFKKKIK